MNTFSPMARFYTEQARDTTLADPEGIRGFKPPLKK